MDEIVYEDHTHSNLSFLEELRKYSLESKLLLCQRYASRIMSGLQVNFDFAYTEGIMPWELESFAAFSILYDDNASQVMDTESFFNFISYIRNYWHEGLSEAELDGTYPERFIMISSLQQLPVQGVALQKLFRHHYFFNFSNSMIDMKAEFQNSFGLDYAPFEEFAYLITLCCSRESSQILNDAQKCNILSRAFQNSSVMDKLTVSIQEYINNYNSLYKGNVTDLYYGLKVHYWYPFISGSDGIYLPSPYLLINAVADSFINRLTLGKDQLRRLFGKEVIENYLYDIMSELPTTTWISKEIVYSIGHNEYLSSDVIVSEGDFCVFYDTKASTPSLKLRKFDKEEIEKDTLEYAKNIVQIYNQINAYENGYFELDKSYNRNHLFGVVVVLEDSAVFRGNVYAKAFDLLEHHSPIDSSTKDYIHSHIKVVSLQQIEIMVLQNCSFLPCLLAQVDSPDRWDNYTFATPHPDNGLISTYKNYGDSIKRRVLRLALES